jgi:hypothetical protein
MTVLPRSFLLWYFKVCRPSAYIIFKPLSLFSVWSIERLPQVMLEIEGNINEIPNLLTLIFLASDYFYFIRPLRLQNVCLCIDVLSIGSFVSHALYSKVLKGFPWHESCKGIYLFYLCVLNRSRVAQSVQGLTTDWTAGVRSPTEAEDFSSNLCVQTGSGAHAASCTVGTGGSLPWG